MPAEKKQQFDTGELLDDINYVNQANKDEIKRVKERIRLRIADADLARGVADAIIEEVSNHLGQLTVKVKLAEKAIRSMRPEQGRKTAPPGTGKAIDSHGADLKFSADQLAGNHNLLPMESSDNGTSYIWSGSSPEILFNFSLDRNKALGLQIRLFALIKPEYSKQLRILVDGWYIKHRYSVTGEFFVLSCNLPASPRTSQTTIKIVLPATHSPKELGTSNDERILGIAINEIRFGKPESGLAHFLKRLKLKS